MSKPKMYVALQSHQKDKEHSTAFARSTRILPRVLAHMLTLGILCMIPNTQAGQLGYCLDQYNIGTPPGNNYYDDLNCTANESAISFINLAMPQPGCFNVGDTGEFEITVGLEGSNTNRYDLGLYINVLGGSARTDDRFEACFQEYLEPNNGTGLPAELLSGFGPYQEFDAAPNNDTCGDLDTADLVRTLEDGNDGIADPTRAALVTLACSDAVDGSGDPNPDGLLDLSGCTAYANVANQDLCGNMTDDLSGNPSIQGALSPGTKAKCNCGEGNANLPPIPVADSSVSCFCAFNSVDRDFDCTVTATNTAPANLADIINVDFPGFGFPENSEQPGTARFVRYLINDCQNGTTDTDPTSPTYGDCTDAGGSFTATGPAAGNNAETTPNGGDTGTIAVVAGADLAFIPQGGRCTGGGPSPLFGSCDAGNFATGQDFVLGPDQMTEFTFTYEPGASPDDIIDITVRAQVNTEDAAFPDDDNTVIRDVNVECQLFATYAGIGDVWASTSAGTVVVNWETQGEAGTLGFDLLRLDPSTGKYVQVNSELLPAAQQAYGGFYAVPDPEASPGDVLTYMIREVEFSGGLNVYGPFELRAGAQGKGQVSGSGEIVTAKGPDPQALERFAKAKQNNGKAKGKDQNGNTVTSLSATSSAATIVGAKLITTQAGLYEVTAVDLASALGQSTNQIKKLITQGKLGLSNKGQPVAWEIGTNGDSMRFYATAHRTMFSHENVYRVSLDGGQTMVQTSGAATGAVNGGSFAESQLAEEDNMLRPFAVGINGDDLWFWSAVNNNQAVDFTVPAPGVNSGAAGDASLTIDIVAGYGATSSAEVTVNNQLLGPIEWTGGEPVSISLPHSMLQADNTVTLKGSSQVFLVDTITVDYERNYAAEDDQLIAKPGDDQTVSIGGFSNSSINVYDVTSANQPVRLAGVLVDNDGGAQRVTFTPSSSDRTYLAVSATGVRGVDRIDPDYASDLAGTGYSANYLVIGPAFMQAAVQPLMDRRAAQSVDGAPVEPKFVDIVEVMDDFNDGILDPNAIAEFVAHAHNNWQRPIIGVLLAGLGHFDYRDITGVGGNLVPPTIAKTPDGFNPADLMLGDADGDGVPEIGVGRVPAVSAEEMTAYVNKVIAYETSGGGDWANDVLMMADNADRGGNFPVDSDALIGVLPEGYEIEKVYLGDTHATAGDAKTAIVAGLNQGKILGNYTGHGSPFQFAGENIFSVTDADGLTNGSRSAVVTSLTCLVNWYTIPGLQVLGEHLILNPDGGSLAVWGPAGFSLNSQAVAFGKRLLPAILDGDSDSLGGRAVSAMQAYAESGGNKTLFVIYTLFGDPLARLQ